MARNYGVPSGRPNAFKRPLPVVIDAQFSRGTCAALGLAADLSGSVRLYKPTVVLNNSRLPDP